MSSFYDLTSASFTCLVPRAPRTVAELQAALDAQDFVSRLVLKPSEPVEVASDTPPLYEWRGLLDGKDVAFRVGVTPTSRLPGSKAKDDAAVLAWPLAIWSTDSGRPEVVGAAAMAVLSWAVAMGGEPYSLFWGRVVDVPIKRRWVDVVLTYHSGRDGDLLARYPDMEPFGGPKPGEQLEIEVRIR